MIYVVEIREKGGEPRVWKARDVGVYQEIASIALNKRMIAAPGTLKEIMATSKDVCEFYEVYVSEWHAIEAIKSGKLPEAAARELGEVISRHQLVQSRGFHLGGGAL